jgi:hypothetical protein
MMKGWKTWLAGLGTIALGVYEIKIGNTESGIQKILAGLGLIGIGHKIEKTTGKQNE